ncbi:MAG TPA: tetratricopeptide repeat protein [Myxococcales bacterium]|nr:tetratricopeptide repeat protein [Myxococcales bacterium]
MKRFWLVALLCGACASGSGGERKPGAAKAAEGAVEVDDVLHGVKYTLPPSPEGWQVAHEGAAHVSGSGVQVDVGSFPLASGAQPASCRDAARERILAIQQRSEQAEQRRGQGAAAQSDVPRDESTSDTPTATWTFTRGASPAPVRTRSGFFARGSDCLVLQVSGPQSDSFAAKVFDSAAKTFKVHPLDPEQQREVDLLAGMGFLERREPAAALDRFEALAVREPNFAKAHFGALMAAFEMGPQAYARGLPHGKAALKSERDLTSEQRQLALRAVGVMQLAENQVKEASETLAELVVRAPDLAEAQYNYACALARLGDRKQALEHLRAAIQLDGDLAGHARDDEDLKSLRGTPEFQDLTRNPPQSAR